VLADCNTIRGEAIMATVTEPEAIESELMERPADITADEFFAMIEAQVFKPDRRVLLWDGRILEKMAKTVPHAFTSVRIGETLRRRLPADWWLWPENPIQLDQFHAPLPDITVVRGPIEVYPDENRHPGANDVGLIVEVAVTSLPKDLKERAEKFARALVPVYWVADVQGHRMIEHRGPKIVDGVGTYDSVKTYGQADAIDLILDGRPVGTIPIAELHR
jgi:Uma2 family endonuclease